MRKNGKKLNKTIIKNCFGKLKKESRSVEELIECIKKEKEMVLDEEDIEFIYEYYWELVSINK